jgi:hypothetical protein
VWLAQVDGQATVTLQIHHACCDGKGAGRFIADVLMAYAQRTDPRTLLRPPDRLDVSCLKTRGQFDARAVAKRTTSVWEKVRNAYGFHVLTPAPLAGEPTQPHDHADSGEPILVRSLLDREQAAVVRQSARRANVSTNDAAVALLFRLLASWNRRRAGAPDRQRLRILAPIDLRVWRDRRLPAANRVSFSFLSRRISQCQDWGSLLEGVREELIYIREAGVALDFVNGVAAGRPVPWLARLMLRYPQCMTTAVLTHLGDPSRQYRRRFAARDECSLIGDVMLTGIYAAPPIRRGTRAGFGICRYGDRIMLSVRCDPQHFTPATSQQLLDDYVKAWLGWAA